MNKITQEQLNAILDSRVDARLNLADLLRSNNFSDDLTGLLIDLRGLKSTEDISLSDLKMESCVIKANPNQYIDFSNSNFRYAKIDADLHNMIFNQSSIGDLAEIRQPDGSVRKVKINRNADEMPALLSVMADKSFDQSDLSRSNRSIYDPNGSCVAVVVDDARRYLQGKEGDIVDKMKRKTASPADAKRYALRMMLYQAYQDQIVPPYSDNYITAPSAYDPITDRLKWSELKNSKAIAVSIYGTKNHIISIKNRLSPNSGYEVFDPNCGLIYCANQKQRDIAVFNIINQYKGHTISFSNLEREAQKLVPSSGEQDKAKKYLSFLTKDFVDDLFDESSVVSKHVVDLITSGIIDVNMKNSRGESILDYARRKHRDDILDLPQEPMIDANSRAQDGGKAIIATDLPQEPMIDVNAPDKNGWTPLAVFVFEGKADKVRELCANPALDINNRVHKIRGITPLQHAIRARDTETVRALCTNPVLNVNDIDSRGQTALTCASSFGNNDAVRALCEHPSIYVNARDGNGDTALIEAIQCYYNNTETVMALCEYPSIDVNVCDKHGFTPLQRAVMISNTQIAKLLLEKGASIEVQNTPEEKTVLDMYQAKHNVTIRRLLETHINKKLSEVPGVRGVVRGLEALPASSTAARLNNVKPSGRDDSRGL